MADRVWRWLNGSGHETFFDRDPDGGIGVGEDWRAVLHAKLHWADAVVCIVSATSVGSPWCIAEVAIAQYKGARVMPILVELNAHHPLLEWLQCADYAADPARAQAAVLKALDELDRARRWTWLAHLLELVRGRALRAPTM